jgi:uncharacterized protein (DUF427 family)
MLSRGRRQAVTTVAPTLPEVRGRVRVEQGAKQIRGFVGGELVVNTIRPLLVWENPYYPTYYFPRADVRTGLLTSEGRASHSPSRGDADVLTLTAGGVRRGGAALLYDASPFESLRDTIRFEWDAMDAWFEEDEQVFTHARDPYTRIDILPSSRHVRVESAGLVIAESYRPTLLFETHLPVRYYLPRTDIRMHLLAPSDTVTHCPYKGEAEYWSLKDDDLGSAVAWSYRTPLPESQKIAGLVSFYPDKVDIYVDKELIPR